MSLRTSTDWLFLAADILLALGIVILLGRRLLRNYDPRERLTAALQALASYGWEVTLLLLLWQWQSGAPLLNALSMAFLLSAAHLLGMALIMVVMLAFVRV